MLNEYEQAKQEFSRGMDIILANCYVISGGKSMSIHIPNQQAKTRDVAEDGTITINSIVQINIGD